MIILITGGSSGLGEAITRALAADVNNEIYFTYNQSRANAENIMADFTNSTAIQCDFKQYEDVNALKSRMAAMVPDVLINNAYSGSFMKAHFHKTNPEDFLNEFSENIIPTLTITQEAISLFRKKKKGKIITILTAALVNVPPAGASAYTANKAYLAQMAKTWATENSKFNITSNTVSPSFMLTNFTKDIDERIVDQMKDNHPLKKILTTNEVADAVCFLVKSSDQINGIDILINSACNIK